jgi:hypothetical protein
MIEDGTKSIGGMAALMKIGPSVVDRHRERRSSGEDG